jgi:hypothetical protein
MTMRHFAGLLFGTLIAAAAYRLPAVRSLVIAGGMLFAALLWAVMQYGIWRAVDAAAAQAFTGWVFAVAHLLFGMMAASFAALAITDADTGYQPAHRRPAGTGGRLPPAAPHGRPANPQPPGRAGTGKNGRQHPGHRYGGHCLSHRASFGYCLRGIHGDAVPPAVIASAKRKFHSRSRRPGAGHPQARPVGTEVETA